MEGKGIVIGLTLNFNGCLRVIDDETVDILNNPKVHALSG